MTGLREVAAVPWEEDLLVTAQFARVVHVWSLVSGAQVATFESVFEFGGRRLALVPGQSPVVVAGAWTRHGVCGYDMRGHQLWQDRSRTNVQTMTALAGGRVAVSCNRGPTRVLDAATGREESSLRGVREVFALSPDLSLAMGSNWCRLLDYSLDPLGARIAVPSAMLVSAATDGEHVAVAEVGGPLRILDLDGRERARVSDHFRHVVHDPVTRTWVVVRESDEGTTSLVRLAHDAEVLEQRRCDPVADTTTIRGGRALALLVDEGVQVVDCSDWSTLTLRTP